MSEEKPKGKRGGRKPGVVIHMVDPTLKIMRKILKSPKKEADESEVMKMYRKMKADEPLKFLDQYRQLEAAHTKSVNEHKARIVQGGDTSNEKCVALAEALLEKIGRKEIP